MPVSIGDDLKAACSDCIKRCARLLGCPLDLHTHAERTRGAVHRAPPAGAVTERITPRQFEAIKRACRQRNVDRTELHALIGRKTGKDGVQNLTKTEASAVLTELTGANGIQ